MVDYTNYKFLEKPIDFLTLLIPKGAKWGEKVVGYDENDEPITEQRTLGEFLTHKRISNDGTKVLFMLCATPDGGHRYAPVTEDDLDDWDGFLKYLSIISGGKWENVTRSEWLDIDEYRSLLKTEDYVRVI